eukprot:TRINITY_DN3065_c0_g1_i2.p1 TRINITY_DN3065_c0_g1~~TRINITY_DN3065_c0_g1_i2.p1  ORF type:complete len:136 (-),score=37.40 TRINITY_DN3065_c0_g1_i2:21-428(-)
MCADLNNLSVSQNALLSSLQSAHSMINAADATRISDTMSRVPMYYNKTQVLQLRMRETTERIEKLSKRTRKLQSKRTDTDLAAAIRKEKEAEKDRALMAKPAASLLEQQQAKQQPQQQGQPQPQEQQQHTEQDPQ